MIGMVGMSAETAPSFSQNNHTVPVTNETEVMSAIIVLVLEGGDIAKNKVRKNHSRNVA